MPIQRTDSSFTPGAKEDDMSNFDHSPFYIDIEDHSNACLGTQGKYRAAMHLDRGGGKG